MRKNPGIHTQLLATLLLGLLLLSASPAAAQVGDISDVNFPGWEPLDRVRAHLKTSVAYDSAGVWRYEYVLANGVDAEQAIEQFDLRYNAPDSLAVITAPDGWNGYLALPPYAAIPGAGFSALPPDGLPGPASQPSAEQIPPGDSLARFSIAGTYPPGYARTYIQGFASTPYVSEKDIPVPLVVPHDTTNSQRGWTLGPTLYSEVMTFGTTEVVNANGFLGFMNVDTEGSVLMDPAPIALKLSVNGETIFPETFMATLNGIDVTGSFFPGASEGADLVAVFYTESSPLLAGDNVLETSIEGLLPGTTTRAIDVDLVTFAVRR